MFKAVCVALCVVVCVDITNSSCIFSAYCDYGQDENIVDESQNCTNIEEKTFEQLLSMDKAYFIRDLTVFNCLEKLTPGSFNNMVNLNELNLEDNVFGKIPLNCFNSSSLVTLKMAECKIESIEEKLGHLPKLLRLVLNNNKLTNFSSEVLSHPENLRYLDLKYNELTILTYEMFSGLKRLNVLNLSFNKINLIEPDSLATMPRINSLGLAGNNIQTLTGNELPRQGFQHLKVLYLGKNRLMFLHSYFLSKLGTNFDIELGENPWHCRCLDIMLKYLEARNISVTDWDNKLAERNDVPYCILPSDTDCDYKYKLPLVHKYLNEINMKKVSYHHADRLVHSSGFVGPTTRMRSYNNIHIVGL
ncbi:phospholipase A2 inhibitor beta-like [Aethina tumida]|uniref:phospholipase A2 inhibitor beta-like n=1 Tax=Aethina tumida TaxID=116153 RepID=UPI002148243F|nr:phospholipase A2 inhibitor beta-like [Aethina tumida]